MRLKKIEIIDFKSVKRETIDVNSNQLCFVGKNESGKSSLILATSYLNILDTEFTTNLLNKSSERYPEGFPMVIGLFELSKTDFTTLKNILKSHFSEKELKFPAGSSDNCLLQLKRWGNGLNNISIKIIQKDSFGLELSKMITDKAKFYDEFFTKLYPTITYFEKEDLLIEPSTVEDLIGEDRQFETFRRLLIIGGCKDFEYLNSSDTSFVTTYISKIETKLNAIFKKHYKQDGSIIIKIVTTFNNKLDLIIQDSSKNSYSIKERSPGFQYYFAFLINKLYNKHISKSKNSILLLDEPGNSLHPKGAKDLLKSFDEIAENSQIFYTTHNPFLVIRNCLDSLIFVDKSETLGSQIKKKPFLNKYQVLRKELGIMLNDSFLIGDINLVVEGNTEKLAFHRLFQDTKFRDLEWMNIYNADGVTNIPQAINYLGKNNLKLSGIVILDSDAEAENIKKNKSYKKNIAEADWEEIEINSVFSDKKDRTFEDLFPQEIYIQAFNKYCHSLSGLEVFEKKYQDFKSIEPLETPIVNHVNQHYKTFLSSSSKSTITKQDVIRHLLDIVDTLSENEQKKVLENAFKLCEKIKTAFIKIEKHVNN
ncbi:AAA family ATPase [Bernardetia sp. MNP-M8]|uniref:ATP-dependent nuclease n=1 Tax=Bernardetia sp. MNP-M8 TaxID=3127470 RepID=UPI0030D205D4